jgi:hypothetical protein
MPSKALSCFDGSAVPSEDPLTPAETAKAPKVSETWRAKAHTPAERMRRYRKRRRQGLQYVRLLLHVTDIDAFVRLGLLKEDERIDADALQTAVLTIVYRAAERVTARLAHLNSSSGK